MARFQGFHINITNGQDDAFATLVYDADITNADFIQGENVSWTGGVGVAISGDQGTNVELRIYNSAAAEDTPAIGEVVTGATSVALGTITAIRSSSLPGYAGTIPNFIDTTEQNAVSVGDILAVRTQAGIVKPISAIVNNEYLTLDSNWTAPTVIDQPAYISQDATTTYEFPIDPERNPMFAEAFKQLDQLLTVPSWTALTPINSWTANGDPDAPFYMKDPFGFVHLKGTVGGGSSSLTTIFQFPAGYRPLKNTYMCTYASGGVDNQIGTVLIDSNGDLQWLTVGASGTPVTGVKDTTPSWVTLDNIIFSTF